MDEAMKEKILAFFEKKRGKKNRLTAKDIVKGLPDENRREVKKTLGDMATEESIRYWSSGSTTYLMLPDLYEELIKAGVEGAQN